MAAPAPKLGKATVTAKKRPIKANPKGLGNEDIARLDTYIARLKSVKNPTAKQAAALKTYTARKSSYRIRMGDTADYRRMKARDPNTKQSDFVRKSGK